MKKIAVVLGEPRSINSEIIAKAWSKLNNLSKKKIFLIGSFKLIKNQLKILKKRIPIERVEKFNSLSNSKKLQIIDIPLNFNNAFSVRNNDAKKYVLKCLNLAHNLASKRKIHGIINCPINKQKTFDKMSIGVTEYLAKKSSLTNSEVMFLYNRDISVVPITTHIELKEVSKKISKRLIVTKIKILNVYYKKIFKKKPKIAILGLNPHNSELRSNSEEKKIIIPAIKFLKKTTNISGPYSADTIFLNKKKFDVIVGMYHDQVLTPIKTLFEYDAINITLGLPFTRISPDHGPNEKMVGKNASNPLSLIRAIEFLDKN